MSEKLMEDIDNWNIRDKESLWLECLRELKNK